jgi:two-component system, OmpR family, sensor histidine kinase SenX3
LTIDEDVALAVGIGAGVVLLLVLVLWWRNRRALLRRLTTAAIRLEDAPPAADPRGVDGHLSRLERAIDRTLLRSNALDLASSRLQRAVEAIPQGVVMCDDGGEVVHRNRVAARLLDGGHSAALVAAAVDELVRAAVAGGADRRTLDLFGPPRRSLVLAGYPLDDDRRTVGALVVIDDVTERRRLEAMRRDFVANISHELKTPIGALSLLAETLLDEEEPAVARRLAERLLREADRVGRTVDDLLELSRLEAEEAQQREVVPVHLVVADAVERARAAAEHRQVPVEVHEPDHRLTLVGDRRQLVSAVHNLVDNATKYSEPGSPVEVAADLVGSNVEITVRDRGVGIPARDLERVFERFYRVDRARSRDTGGTGLGLAIVRHVAANHGGECRVASREGEGSAFTLVVPVGPATAARAAG